MSLLEELLEFSTTHTAMTVWHRLTVGNDLFRALRDAVQTNEIPRVENLLARSKNNDRATSEANSIRSRIADAMIACAWIASLSPQTATATDVATLLRRIEPTARLPEPMAPAAASIGEAKWRPFIRQCLYRLDWKDPLSPEWAWDTVSAFFLQPPQHRPVARSESLVALLVEGDGATARLTFDLLGDIGHGKLYPDPACMSFTIRETRERDRGKDAGQSFREAEQNALQAARALATWHDANLRDVRWRIERHDKAALPSASGGSAGGAFALGLLKLFAADYGIGALDAAG